MWLLLIHYGTKTGTINSSGMFNAGLIPRPGWKYPAWSVADQSQALHLLVFGPALQTAMSYKAGTYELPKVPTEAILHAG